MTNNNDTTLQVLAKRLASARNRLYEATMGVREASIDRAQNEYNQLKQEALDLGYNYDELTTWSDTQRCWVATV